MESSLSLTVKQLQSAVGFHLGYGRGPDADEEEWDTRQLNSINDCVESGLRQFYSPPKLPGETEVHDWSFLHPVATLPLLQGESTLDLPDDAGGVEGVATINYGTANLGVQLPYSSVGEVLQKQQINPSATGRPTIVCVEPLRGTSAHHGQSHRLRFWPVADRDYSVQIEYYLVPNKLTAANPYPLGGGKHAETIKQSCLACAEYLLDNTLGPMNTKYLERLSASIADDRKFKPQNLGYNGDGSDGVMEVRSPFRVTYNGILYD